MRLLPTPLTAGWARTMFGRDRTTLPGRRPTFDGRLSHRPHLGDPGRMRFLEWRAHRDVRGRSCRDLPINIEPFDPRHRKLEPWQKQTQRRSLLRGCGLYTYLLTPSARFSAAILRAPLGL